MAKMRAMQVRAAGAPFELVERDVPQPGRGQALVRVHACGIRHSDSFAKDGGFPGVTYPVVPGHEIAGTIASLGQDAHAWEVGQRVGVGWFGGNCAYLLAEVRPIVETLPLEQAEQAYEKMISGDARFRMVAMTGA